MHDAAQVVRREQLDGTGLLRFVELDLLPWLHVVEMKAQELVAIRPLVLRLEAQRFHYLVQTATGLEVLPVSFRVLSITASRMTDGSECE